MVPFDKSVPESIGKGIVYWGNDSNNIRIKAEKKGRVPCSFLVLKNSTSNDAINIIITKECTDNKRVVREEFAIPYWSHQSLLYLPVTFFEADPDKIRVKKFQIEYSTKSLERFRFEIIRSTDGSYKKLLSKKYFKLIWIKKIQYAYVGQLHFQKVE